ncbi:type I restriction enzyme HsdR N-terminal domain-containing protein [Streptomyces sp. BH055]|uniref:type I restriction enzyme HsdR N-terminal domain-containing protein n=1 Tax=Streptomyces sp. BH055 TaxID=3401173 RepID=UPI003BB80A7A
MDVAMGDRVRVPWGVDETEGTVVAVYGEGPSQRVVVSLDREDSTEEIEPSTVTFRTEYVELIDEETEPSRAGNWVEEIRYERQLREAITKTLERVSESVNSEVVEEVASAPGRRYDLALRHNGVPVLVVEAKTSERTSLREGVDQLRGHLSQLPDGVSGLLVTKSGASSPDVDETGGPHPVASVQWRDSKDNQKLSRAIRKLLSRSTAF